MNSFVTEIANAGDTASLYNKSMTLDAMTAGFGPVNISRQVEFRLPLV